MSPSGLQLYWQRIPAWTTSTDWKCEHALESCVPSRAPPMSRNYQIRMPQPLPRWMMNRWKKMAQLNQPTVKHLETYRNVVWQLKQPPLRQVETHHEGDAAGDPDAMDEGVDALDAGEDAAASSVTSEATDLATGMAADSATEDHMSTSVEGDVACHRGWTLEPHGREEWQDYCSSWSHKQLQLR